MTDPITPEERRYLLSQIDDTDRTDSLVRKLMARHDELSATLARVRGDNRELVSLLRRALHVRMHANGLADWAQVAQAYLATPHDAALASQPEVVTLDPHCPSGTVYAVGQHEAPREKCAYCAAPPNFPDSYLYRCERCISQPEAPKALPPEDDYDTSGWRVPPKGPAAEAEDEDARDDYDRAPSLFGGDGLDDPLAAANARIEEAQTAERLARATASILTESLRQTDSALVAAKARIAELEEKYEIVRGQRNNANTRADAAERARNEAHDLGDALAAERDQLAARVTQLQDELEQQHTLKPMQLCTPEEWQVLGAMREIQIERSSFGDCYMVPRGLQPLLEAELANRAAKAKREVMDAWRTCGFCGCLTNSRKRACCEPGRLSDLENAKAKREAT